MTPTDPIPPPVTPEPLSEQEFDALAAKVQSSLDRAHGFNLPCECGVCENYRIILRLIAQARAASAFGAEMKSVIRSKLASMSDEEIVRISDELAREQEQARAARQSPWQPIETAPKDGTWILCWPNHAEAAPRADVLRWSAYCGIPAWNNGDYMVGGVSHWQHLPAPPAQDGGRP